MFLVFSNILLEAICTCKFMVDVFDLMNTVQFGMKHKSFLAKQVFIILLRFHQNILVVKGEIFEISNVFLA